MHCPLLVQCCEELLSTSQPSCYNLVGTNPPAPRPM